SVVRNNGDTPTGLWIPHWFMNSLDYHAFFRPGEGAQAPLLFTAISAARASAALGTAQHHIFSTINDVTNQIDLALKDPPSGNAAFYAKKNMRERALEPLKNLLAEKQEIFEKLGYVESWSVYHTSCDVMLTSVKGEGAIDAQANN